MDVDAQSQLLTHGPFYTNYISIGQRRGNTNYNVSFENTKQEGVLILLRGYNRQNFRVNVDQALTPRFDLSVGGFFGKSNNNQVTEGPGSPFFTVTFLEPYVNMFAPNPDGTPYAASDPHLLAWVHAAEADSFLLAHQVYGREPLDQAGRRRDHGFGYIQEPALL